ncbi:MAG: tetratricopeptide repeat protein [candidate division KSB1 bacterium]|nr:tetratricopeptide repeat protein [candidate division KSB1 bacterium]MDZ7336009.1 tetratricopeptide repeat protein [candidate division KSB1 bacterium]MDZ7358483.1 tetratricopeptide repeat protein [candidate division KSB1 bacterium]MDZ7376482.1 tetratricopeptide repeat protein [candidate division KSB1 bacterium]MDZ7402023.1 tetratricopeptide repeat protein [candidate division KSB1 bacterium]
MMSSKSISIWVMAVVLMLHMPMLMAQDDDFKLFNEAMDLRIRREWDQALERYRLLKQNFPNSKYIDDAEFWSAYILEEQGKDEDAFFSYQQLKDNYPNSPWADDATMHQIGLAEKFVRQGHKSYERFLIDHLESSDKNVKYQAALSLGKLGDERAIPVLREMANNGDKDMRFVGKALLQRFESPQMAVPSDESSLTGGMRRSLSEEEKGRHLKQPPKLKSDRQPARVRKQSEPSFKQPSHKPQPSQPVSPRKIEPSRKGRMN